MIGDVITPTKSRSYAIQAGAALILATIFSNMTFNFFGIKTSFLFAPFIVLFLWPKGADQNISYVAIFLACLLLDILSGEPLGGWGIIYLPAFAILSLFSGRAETGFAETFITFLLSFSAFGSLFLVASFTRLLNVNYMSFLKMIIVCIVLFPIIYVSKDKLRAILVGEDG